VVNFYLAIIKSRIIIKNFPYKIVGLIIALAALLIGYFTNRVFYSVGILFAAVFVVTTKNWYKEIRRDRFLASFLLLPFIVLVADLSSNGIEVISQSTFFTKLTLFLLPLFITVWKPKAKETMRVHFALYLLLMVNLLYSFFHFFLDQEQVMEGYKFAKVMKVMSLNDHIRISWLSAIAVILAIRDSTLTTSKTIKYLLFAFILIQVIYLHVLSAKTGLLCLYSSLLIYSIYLSYKSSIKKGIITLITLITLPIAAYFLVPSFERRIGYVRWDFSEFLSGAERAGLSDGNRFHSIHAGVSIFKENPMGIGFVNIQDTTNQWLMINKKFLSTTDYILPSSEFLIYAVGGGIIGLFLLVLHFAMPFTYKEIWKDSLFPSIYLPALVTFMYEIHFEGQLSLFVYAFFVFWVYYLAKSRLIN